MSEELSRIWGWRYKALHADVAGLKAEMQWVRLRLAPDTTSQTQSSQTSSSVPTASPPKSWAQRTAASALDKLGREALTQFALWLAGMALKWIAPWLVAWWTMGAPLMRFLERWAALLLG